MEGKVEGDDGIVGGRVVVRKRRGTERTLLVPEQFKFRVSSQSSHRTEPGYARSETKVGVDRELG